MNKAILVGRLTKDPELTQTTTGISVCRFTVAVNRRFKNAAGETEADFLNCIAWRATAENLAQYQRKGAQIGVVGVIQTRSYDAQDGTKRYVTEIIADEVEFLSPKSEDRGEPTPPPEKKPKTRVEDLEPVEDEDLPF